MVGPSRPVETISICDKLDEAKVTLAALAVEARSRPKRFRPNVRETHDGCMLEFRYDGGTEAQMRLWVKGHAGGDGEDE